MTLRNKLVLTATTIVVLGASGVGIAQAVSSEDRVSGPEADKAEKAAIKAVPDGRVVDVEREDDGRQGWEVEVAKPDGRQVEVHLTPQLKSIGVESDDADEQNDD
ncbi:MAG: PepSY domain-containing protein [Solirubrobacteraceae bacterium]